MVSRSVRPRDDDLPVITGRATDDRAVDGRRVVVILLIAVFVGPLIWFFLGMPGMDHSSASGTDGMPEMGAEQTTGASRPLTRMSAAEFDERLSDAAVTVVNVHVPYEGELRGTDAFVAFDRVVGDPAIPTDRNAQVLLYCRTGRMSKIAGEVLISDGYLYVADLDGGMDAWEKTGRPVAHDPRKA